MVTEIGKFRWGRVLLGGFLIELALMLVAVALFSTMKDPATALNITIPPATLVAAVPIAAWVARSSSRPILAGTATGTAALLLYVLIAVAGTLARPDQADWGQTLGPAYLASDAFKVIGGALGGWWGARKRPATA
jgi:hypothetical protein